MIKKQGSFTILFLITLACSILTSCTTIKPAMDKEVAINLFDPSFQTLQVSNKEEITSALENAMLSGEMMVYFNMAKFTGANEDIEMMITNAYYAMTSKNPDLKYVQNLVSTYHREQQLLSVKINYLYTKNNQDVFLDPNAPSDYGVFLEKKVVKVGETMKIQIAGENPENFTLEVTSADPSIVSVDTDHGLIAQGDGVTSLTLTIIGESDSQTYEEAFSITVLPQDVKEVNSLLDLIHIANEGYPEDGQPIFIKNKELRVEEMQRALFQAGESYFVCQFNTDFTAIINEPTYGITRAQCLDKIKQIDEKSNEIIMALIAPHMSELEKETILYNYVIANTIYDYRYYNDLKNLPYDARTAYGPLFTGTGICGGYAYTMKTLLNKVGIECYTVSGLGGGEQHMWNIAKIDGKYYHLDATFDSTSTHATEELSHKNFNRSDEKFRENHSWDQSIFPLCTDTQYDNR